METLEFLLTIAVFAAVLFWYLQNARAGADGTKGLLALADDPDIVKHGRRKAYREKPRAARKAAMAKDIRDHDRASPAYAEKDAARMRRRFRRQDEARYRVKDKAASFRTKGPKAPA